MARNEGKFEKAYGEYEQLNKDCFETMVKVLSNRFKIITPTVGRYMSLTQKLFGSIARAKGGQSVDPPMPEQHYSEPARQVDIDPGVE